MRVRVGDTVTVAVTVAVSIAVVVPYFGADLGFDSVFGLGADSRWSSGNRSRFTVGLWQRLRPTIRKDDYTTYSNPIPNSELRPMVARSIQTPRIVTITPESQRLEYSTPRA